MTKEQAELLKEELTELFKEEQVILAESREWEHFMPKHVYLGRVGTISSFQEGQNWVLGIMFNGMQYNGFDNPVIYIKTILFTVINGTGKKIYRSFTLAREWKDNQEMSRWISLAYAFI